MRDQRHRILLLVLFVVEVAVIIAALVFGRIPAHAQPLAQEATATATATPVIVGTAYFDSEVTYGDYGESVGLLCVLGILTLAFMVWLVAPLMHTRAPR